MAFSELAAGLRLPRGASERYRRLEALGRMLTGQIYDDLPYSFETETTSGKPHVLLRERRPSVDFNLAYEITQDTSAELFGDEQFPIIHVLEKGEENEEGSRELSELIEAIGLQAVLTEAYEEGVIGAVGVVIHRSDDGSPYFEVLPAKFCEPIYRSPYSKELLALSVTYPIDRETAEEMFPGFTQAQENKGVETFWYRYIVGPVALVDYYPLADDRYARLGEPDDTGDHIEFRERGITRHGFAGRTPAVYTRNFGGKGRDLDGMALWWPIRNICIELDYTLSQAGRGLRYSADPMLFIRKGDMDSLGGPIGAEKPAGGMATALDAQGRMVKGATQTLVGDKGSDAKLLEMNAAGIKEEREYAADLREYALEVIGGMKARAMHASAPMTGRAIDKNLKPLRRVVRRQRRPYGLGMLVGLVDLTLYGLKVGALSSVIDHAAIPNPAQYVPEWPTEENLQGQDLLYHVQGLQMAAGGSQSAPIQLITPTAMGAKLSADLGMHEPYEAIKGTLVRPSLPGETPPQIPPEP